jgi:hypothetical protein
MIIIRYKVIQSPIIQSLALILLGNQMKHC